MRKIHIFLLVVMALLVFSNPVYARKPEPRYFATGLSGRSEVPVRVTKAFGLAGFEVDKYGKKVDYKIIVTNIKNVSAAHIHCAAAGVNGPVGVTLYMGMAGSGKVSGVLVSSSFTAPDANNGCGWTSLADVVNAMASGNTYVNVHTNDGVNPPNTGPGDFPGGEIRGQIDKVGRKVK